MIFNNPEFKKNIKLEFSPARVLIPAIILLLGTWLAWSTSSLGNQNNFLPKSYANAQSLTSWAFTFGFIFSIIWGSHLVANSLFGEIRQKTWDFMRMSSLAPEKILIGKLFGAPATIWAITILGIFPIVLYSAQYLFPDGGYHRPMSSALAALLLSMLLWMIFSYSLVMLAGLHSDGKSSRHTASGTVLMALAIGLSIGAMIRAGYANEYSIYDACRFFKATLEIPTCTGPNFRMIDGVQYTSQPITTINWYGFKFFPLDMAVLMLAYAAFWTVTGVYRMLRTALQYRDAPFIWPIFLITTAIFLNGYGHGDRSVPTYLTGVAFMFVLAVIPACVKEAKNIVGCRKLYESLKTKNYKEAFRLTPLSILSLLTFIIIAPIMFLNAGEFQYNGTNTETSAPLMLLYLSLILLATRDIIALHLIAWRKTTKNPAMGFAMYFLFIYLLIPIVVQKAIGTDTFLYFTFMPIVQPGTLGIASTTACVALASQSAMALIAIILLKRRWEKGEDPK